MAVVVLYRCTPESSTTVQTLTRALDRAPGLPISVLLYDNSPLAWQGALAKEWQYVHDPANGGILAAYSKALELAEADGGWLLLLDQDSRLGEDFLEVLEREMVEAERDPQVAAIVPVVKHDATVVSPRRVLTGRTTPLCRPGVSEKEITAINSGAAIRVRDLVSVGGFNREFWLDYQDYWLFDALARQGKKVFVSRNVLQHRLSVHDLAGSVSVDRYRNILEAEMRFVNGYRPWLERAVLLARLGLRCLRQSRSAALSRLAPLSRRAFVQQAGMLLRGKS